MINFTWATLSEQREQCRKKEKLCQAVPQNTKHRSRERAARWCWQCCNTGSRSLWNGLRAYAQNKTSPLHKRPACACILVIPALRYVQPLLCYTWGLQQETCDRLLSTEPSVGGWRCPEGFVRSAAPAPPFPRADRPHRSPDSLRAGGGGLCVSRQPEVLPGLAAGSSTA